MYPITSPPTSRSCLPSVTRVFVCIYLYTLTPTISPAPIPPVFINQPGRFPVPGFRLPSSLSFLSFCFPDPDPIPFSSLPWSSAPLLFSPISATSFSTYLPPRRRFPTSRPPGVVASPPTVIPLPSGGLCTWPPTSSPPPVALYYLSVSLMNHRPAILIVSP